MAGVLTAGAQSVVVNTVDNQQVRYNVSQVESITFVENIEFVDLGLPSGTQWATTNVGASKPEDFGDYFA